MEENKSIYGVLAEFDSAADLMHAAEKVRDAGYKEFDCHSPFPIHGMDEAMGLKRSPLGWIVGIMAFTGLGLAYWLQGWTSTTAYPLVIAGKPYFSYQAYVPVGFGIAVLFGALSAFLGMLALNKLPQPWHPVFFSNNFEKMTTNGFFISIEAKDKIFDAEESSDFLTQIGGKNVELLQGK
jgi:hypothetical protein